MIIKKKLKSQNAKKIFEMKTLMTKVPNTSQK